jgi:hypothetical protein
MNYKDFGIEVYEESPGKWRYYLIDPVVGEDRSDRGWFGDSEAAMKSAKTVVDMTILRRNRAGSIGPGPGGRGVL